MKKIAIISFATLLSACSMTTKDVVGTYQGNIPCADCDNIVAKLVLNKDKSYFYETRYFQNNKQLGKPYPEHGKFTLENDLITLGENSRNLKFKVGKGFIEMTDSEGNTVKNGKDYILKQVPVKVQKITN